MKPVAQAGTGAGGAGADSSRCEKNEPSTNTNMSQKPEHQRRGPKMETKTSNDARPRENSGLANSTRTYSAQRERKRKKEPEHIKKGNYGTTIDFSRTSCPWRLHSLRMSLYCVHAQTMVAAHRLLSRRLRGTLHPLRRISCVVIASVVSVQSHPCRQHSHVQHSISIAFKTTRLPEGSLNHDGLLGSHNQSISKRRTGSSDIAGCTAFVRLS